MFPTLNTINLNIIKLLLLKEFSSDQIKIVASAFNKNSNHWCLIFINIEMGEFYYIDPMVNLEDGNKAFKNWR